MSFKISFLNPEPHACGLGWRMSPNYIVKKMQEILVFKNICTLYFQRAEALFLQPESTLHQRKSPYCQRFLVSTCKKFGSASQDDVSVTSRKLVNMLTVQYVVLSLTRPFLQDFKMMPSFSVANVVPGLPFSNMTEQQMGPGLPTICSRMPKEPEDFKLAEYPVSTKTPMLSFILTKKNCGKNIVRYIQTGIVKLLCHLIIIK